MSKKRISWDNISEIFEKVVEFIKEAEEFIGMSGSEKKEYVIELIMSKYNVKWLPDAWEKQLYGVMIDLTILLFNKYIGKKWLGTIA